MIHASVDRLENAFDVSLILFMGNDMVNVSLAISVMGCFDTSYFDVTLIC